MSKNADVLIHVAGVPEKYKISIMAIPSEAGRVAKEADVKKLFLTHFYPVVENYNAQKDVRKYYQGPIVIAKDLMKINI